MKHYLSSKADFEAWYRSRLEDNDWENLVDIIKHTPDAIGIVILDTIHTKGTNDGMEMVNNELRERKRAKETTND